MRNAVFGEYAVAFGGSDNTASGQASFAVGQFAKAQDDLSAVFAFSGEECLSQGPYTLSICTQPGGLFANGELVGDYLLDDTIAVNSEDYATVGGGYKNSANGAYSTVVGGAQNVANGDYAFVGGGIRAHSLSNYASVGGGLLNVAVGRFASVPGGSHNTASAQYSFAAGYQAKASYRYSASFGFGNGNSDDGSCQPIEENSVQFCSETLVMNGQDLVAKIAESRRLSEGVDDRLKSVTAQSKAISEQEILLAEQRKQIEAMTKMLMERQSIIKSLEISLA